MRTRQGDHIVDQVVKPYRPYYHLQVTLKSNYDFILRWVSVSTFVGQPPTKKEVQACSTLSIGYINAWNLNCSPKTPMSSQAALAYVNKHHRLNSFEDKEAEQDYMSRFQNNYRHLLYTRVFHPRVQFRVFLGNDTGRPKKRYAMLLYALCL